MTLSRNLLLNFSSEILVGGNDGNRTNTVGGDISGSQIANFFYTVSWDTGGNSSGQVHLDHLVLPEVSNCVQIYNCHSSPVKKLLLLICMQDGSYQTWELHTLVFGTKKMRTQTSSNTKIKPESLRYQQPRWKSVERHLPPPTHKLLAELSSCQDKTFFIIET